MENAHEILTYIKDNPVMVLCTVGSNNTPHSAAVFVCATSAHQLYFITKTDTRKFQNLLHTPQVSLTIVNSTDNTSLQAEGRAEVINDAIVIELVMSKMSAIYAGSADWLPPITKLRAGPYQVVGVKIKQARLAKFLNVHPGDQHIFKEL